MPEGSWRPPLRLSEHDGGCRLSLEGLGCGHGDSLQQAADDLMAKLRRLALSVRSNGLRTSTDIGQPDLRLLEFLWELGERAARGEDLRAHVLDSTPPPSSRR